MTDRNNIQDELKDLNSNLPWKRGQAPFSVPDGYFDGLASAVLARIKTQSAVAEELAELSPLLSSVPKTMPYTLPEGYFEENLSLLPFLSGEEKASPLLSRAGKDMLYTVPQGYFESLPQQVLAKIGRPQAKVVPLFSRGWMRAAIAAVVGGIIFISGYQYFNNTGDAQTASQQAVDTSKTWVAKNDPAALQGLKAVSPKELEEFIETVPLTLAGNGEKSSVTVGKGEVESLLKGVSEKEIKSFLEQLPIVDEDLTIIN
jgi:hypothetical protein